jgi:putative lipoic acid-binding regulatory protein
MGPMLTFPTTFPVKVMGTNEDDFEPLVLEIIQKHASTVEEQAVTRRLSRGGRFLSLTVYIHAESQAQLDAIYRELSAHERVLMML